MCGSIILAIGAVIALTFAWQGLIKQRVVLTRQTQLENASATAFGVVCLLLGIVLSMATVLWTAAHILAMARRMAG